MSNTTDKPETNTHWANIFHYLLGSGTLMGCWYGEKPNGLMPFWWRKALREELESNEAKINSLESQLKEKDEWLRAWKESHAAAVKLVTDQTIAIESKDREIAALKESKGHDFASSVDLGKLEEIITESTKEELRDGYLIKEGIEDLLYSTGKFQPEHASDLTQEILKLITRR